MSQVIKAVSKTAPVLDELPELPEPAEYGEPNTAHDCLYTADQMREYAQAAIAALASSEPAGAEERARELLAAEYAVDGLTFLAEALQERRDIKANNAALRAIAAALRQQPVQGDSGRASELLWRAEKAGHVVVSLEDMRLLTALQSLALAEVGEPVAWRWRDGPGWRYASHYSTGPSHAEPLYTTPTTGQE